MKVLIALLILIPMNLTYALNKKVLILHSYHPQYEWTKKLNDGAISKLNEIIPKEEIFIEYLDGRRFIDDQAYENIIIEYLSYKYKNKISIDLIISSDDYALDFLLKYKNQIFGNSPVIFSGVNSSLDERNINRAEYTGVLEGISINENIELIKSLHPKVKQISIISDRSNLGIMMTKEVVKQIQGQNYRIIDDYTLDELSKTLKNLPPDDIPLLVAIHKDKEGKYFSYHKDLINLTLESSNPVYGMWGIINGLGVVGGMMNDATLHGHEVAEYAIKVLTGQKIKDIPIKKKGLFVPQFDYVQLVKYKIKERNLPKDSKIINKPVGFYENHKPVINFFSLLLLISITLIIILNSILRKRSKELTRARLKLNELIGIVAHDLRSPIGFIYSMSDLLRNDPSEAEEGIKLINTSAEKSIELVNNILTLSALELGKLELNITAVDLKEAVQHKITELDFLTHQKNIKIISKIPDATFVKADKARLEQIIQNLLTNSIKFSNPEDEVTVSCESINDEICLSVSDNGVGMSKETQSKIFKMGESRSKQGTKGEQGTGYGLPLVYFLVKKHGSLLEVTSELNQGSKFYFKLKKA